MEEKVLQLFKDALSDLGIQIEDYQLEQFLKYYEVMIERNKVTNLTGITEFEEVIKKHFIDSLAVVKSFDIGNITSLIDIGTGAGFPGIPLKIIYPNLKVTLLDSLKKRVNFLDDIIQILDLKGVETLHGRAEDYAMVECRRESYELCVSRAVANLASLAEYCLPFVKESGYFISYKSGKIEEEITEAKNAVFILGGSIKEKNKIILPKTDIERTFVIIKKVKKTPKKYPRKAGLPTKEPIR